MCLSFFAFLSCEKEHDVSFLQGSWESTEVSFRLAPEDPLLAAAIRKEVDRLCDSFLLRFEEEHQCQEYRYKNGTQISMFSGTYFYNNGYKMRFHTSDFLGRTVINFDLDSKDSMTGRFNVTKAFRNPTYLEQLGVSDPESCSVEKVEIIVQYRRVNNNEITPLADPNFEL